MQVPVESLDAALADLAIAVAQSSVRAYLDQDVTLVEDDEVLLDGAGKPWLRLPQRPVRSIVLVEEGDGAEASFTTVDPAAYVLRRSLLFRVDGSCWQIGNVNYRVTYTHGWDVGAVDSDSDSDFDSLHVPADLVLATLSAARRTYEAQGDESTGGVVQETIGSYSYTTSAQVRAAAGVDLIAAEKVILDRYRVGGAG